MPTLAELRSQLPELQGLDDERALQVLHQVYYSDMDLGRVAKAVGYQPPAPPPPSFTDRLKRGLGSTANAVQLTMADRDEVAGLVAEEVRNQLPQTEAAKQMAAEVEPYRKAYDKAEGADAVLPALKLGFKYAQTFAMNPREVAGMIVESLPNSAPGLAAGGAGAAAGTATPVPGGAIAGGVVGGIAGGYWVEQGAALRDQIIKEAVARGVDPSNADALAPIVAEKYDEFLEKARLKGAGTATVDAVMNVVTFGVAGAGERALVRSADKLGDAIKSGAISAERGAAELAQLEARQLARNTIPARLARGAGVTAMEMGGEGLSEYAGQKLAYGEADPGEVITEGLLGVGQGAVMAAGRGVVNRVTGSVTQDAVNEALDRPRVLLEQARQRLAQATTSEDMLAAFNEANAQIHASTKTLAQAVAAIPPVGSTATEPSAEVVDSPFADRVLDLRNKLSNDTDLALLRERFGGAEQGGEAVNQALYYLNLADDPNNGLPDKTREKLLGLAEAIVQSGRVRDLGASQRPDPFTPAGAPERITGQPYQRLGMDEPALRIGMDTSPSGTMVADQAGNVRAQTRAESISNRQAQAERDSLGQGTPRGTGRGPRPLMQLAQDKTTTDRLVADGQGNVRPELRSEQVARDNETAAQRIAREQAAQLGLTPDVIRAQQVRRGEDPNAGRDEAEPGGAGGNGRPGPRAPGSPGGVVSNGGADAAGAPDRAGRGDGGGQVEDGAPAALSSDVAGESFSIDPLGWNPKRLAESYSLEQLNRLASEVRTRFANKIVGDGPVDEKTGLATKEPLNERGTKLYKALQKAADLAYERRKAGIKPKAAEAPSATTSEAATESLSADEREALAEEAFELLERATKAQREQVADALGIQREPGGKGVDTAYMPLLRMSDAGADPKRVRDALQRVLDGEQAQAGATPAEGAGDARPTPANTEPQVFKTKSAATVEARRTGGQVEAVEGGYIVKPKPAKPRKQDPRRVVNVERDTMMQAIAKLGGINRESASRFGLTAEELKYKADPANPTSFAFRVSGGYSADSMRELLAELGYFTGVPEDEQMTAMEDSIKEEMGGFGARMTPEGDMRLAQQQQERAAEDDERRQAEQAEQPEPELDEYALAEREAIMSENGLTDADMALAHTDDDLDLVLDALLDGAPVENDPRALQEFLGYTDEEINDANETQDAAGAEAARGEGEAGQAGGEGPGEVRAADEPGEGQAREGRPQRLSDGAPDDAQLDTTGAGLPAGVRDGVRGALNMLRDLHRKAEANGPVMRRRFLDDELSRTIGRLNTLALFREAAARQGYDAERVIDRLGPEPLLRDLLPQADRQDTKLANDERLVLLCCGETKLDRDAPARELYTGPTWQTFRTHAPADLKNVAVVSAEYGLVHGDEQLATYEQPMTLRRQAVVRANLERQVEALAERLGKPVREVIIVGGFDYRQAQVDAVLRLMQAGKVAPEANIIQVDGQIGEQRQKLGELLRAMPRGEKPTQLAPSNSGASVTPQVPSDRQLASFIGIAADSVEQLRKVDVERVITEAPAQFRVGLANHIAKKRPDLADEAREVAGIEQAKPADPQAPDPADAKRMANVEAFKADPVAYTAERILSVLKSLGTGSSPMLTRQRLGDNLGDPGRIGGLIADEVVEKALKKLDRDASVARGAIGGSDTVILTALGSDALRRIELRDAPNPWRERKNARSAFVASMRDKGEPANAPSHKVGMRVRILVNGEGVEGPGPGEGRTGVIIREAEGAYGAKVRLDPTKRETTVKEVTLSGPEARVEVLDAEPKALPTEAAEEEATIEAFKLLDSMTAEQIEAAAKALGIRGRGINTLKPLLSARVGKTPQEAVEALRAAAKVERTESVAERNERRGDALRQRVADFDPEGNLPNARQDMQQALDEFNDRRIGVEAFEERIDRIEQASREPLKTGQWEKVGKAFVYRWERYSYGRIEEREGNSLMKWRTSDGEVFAGLRQAKEHELATKVKAQLQRDGFLERDDQADEELLASQTEADLAAKTEREGRADELDDQAQIQREADGFSLAPKNVETRTDTTGDMFGAELAEAKEAAKESKATRGDGMSADLFGAEPEQAATPAAADIEPELYAQLEGATVEQEVRIEDTGETATLRLDAAAALRQLDERRKALEGLKACIGRND